MSLLYPHHTFSLGLLILRIGIGIAFILHGYPKVADPSGLAGFLTAVNVPEPSTAAMLAGLAELIGGVTLILGLLFRPTTLVLAFTMIIAVYAHSAAGGGFSGKGGYSHALESAILFISLFITGPGKYSIDAALFKKKD